MLEFQGGVQGSTRNEIVAGLEKIIKEIKEGFFGNTNPYWILTSYKSGSEVPKNDK